MPETDPTFLDPYRVEGPVAIKALLRDLIAKRAFVAIYSSRDFDDFVISQILAFDDQQVDLDFVTDDARQKMILAGGKVLVIGLLETVKVQFDLEPATMVQTPAGWILRGPLPKRVYRIQRRDAFRVRPRLSDTVSVSVRGPSGTESLFRVIDFSVGGLAYAINAGEPLPREGTTHTFSRVECPDRAPIPCELLVRHVSAGLRSENGAHRIGCEFNRLESEAARALQIAVIDMERRYRHTAKR